jgi:hypothetical protein
MLAALLLSAAVFGSGCIINNSFRPTKHGFLGKPLGTVDDFLWGKKRPEGQQSEFAATDKAQLPAGSVVEGCGANGYGCEHAHYVCKVNPQDSGRINFAVEIFTANDAGVVDNKGFFDPAYNHLCASRPLNTRPDHWFAYPPHGRELERQQ